MVSSLSRIGVHVTLQPAKFIVSSFHGHRRCSIHMLFGKSSVSNCKTASELLSGYFESFGFSGYSVIRKAGSISSSAKFKHHVAGGKHNLNRDLKSPPSMPFDICRRGNALPTLKNALSEEDEKQDSEMHQPGSSKILRKGMVLLKGYLTQDEQVSIVKKCSSLGLGRGGFYQPPMRLMLMCLGQDWDPHKRDYNKTRRFDNSNVPSIPDKFLVMVKRAMDAVRNVEGILPNMSPDVCIVNFYATQGRLGLHQDKDESRESLDKGLPIVSISVGDSAEFLFGKVRDERKAKKVTLESGDVVIFGGPSRHIYHGVQSIRPGTAPKSLLKETGLRPGRLNLTFRQHKC